MVEAGARDQRQLAPVLSCTDQRGGIAQELYGVGGAAMDETLPGAVRVFARQA